MKKFNALFFAATLLVVVAFASMAGAATTLVGIHSNDAYAMIITVEGSTLTEKELDGTTTGALINKNASKLSTDHRVYAYDGAVVIVSKDLHRFTVSEDGYVEYDKTIQGVQNKLPWPIQDVVMFKNNPVFIGRYGFATIDTTDDGMVSVDFAATSLDVAFPFESNFYVLASADDSKEHILEFSDITAKTKSNDKIPSSDIRGFTATDASHYITPSLVADNLLYVASKDAIYTAALEAKLVGNLKLEPTDVKGEFLAISKQDDENIFGILSGDGGELKLVQLKVTKNETIENGITTVTKSLVTQTRNADISSDIGGVENPSLDVYANDEIVVVVSHGKAFAVYEAKSPWTFLTSSDKYVSVAMAGAAASEEKPETPEIPSGAVVDITAIGGAGPAIATALNTTTDKFVKPADVTSADVTLTTSDADANAKISEDVGGAGATITAVIRKYTLTEGGYLLVAAPSAYTNASTYLYYFIKESASATSSSVKSAAVDDAILGKGYTSTGTAAGTAAYVASSESLEAGDYTLVVAQKASTTTPPKEEENNGGTGSGSGGGCNAGFGLLSIAALAAAFKKLSERR